MNDLSFFAPTTDGATHAALQQTECHSETGRACRTTPLLLEALQAGERGMAVSMEAAQRTDPAFKDRASTVILAHLKAVGQASGEDLTDIARAHGVVPQDDRAFGGVFQSLARKGLIRCVGLTLRRKGHGTAGGRIWAAA